MNKFEGKLVAEGLKVGIIVGRFNEFIGGKLLDGALDGLIRHGVKEEDIDFLAKSAFEDACRPGNPRETSIAQIKEIYMSLI